jgi:hypothetical protein
MRAEPLLRRAIKNMGGTKNSFFHLKTFKPKDYTNIKNTCYCVA